MPRRSTILLGLTGFVLAVVAVWQLHKALKGDAESAFRISEVICLAVAACVVALALLHRRRSPVMPPSFPGLRSLAWLLAGWFVIFLAVGFACGPHVEARFLCRGLCVVWGAAVLTASFLPKPPLFRVAVFARASLIVGNVAVLGVAGELLLRTLALVLGPEPLLLDTAGGYRLTPGVYSHGLRVNSLGFADDEFQELRRPGVQRIVWLGDSFSAATAMSHEANCVTRLERELGDVEIFNLGVCGTGPREYAALMRTLGWRFRPDLVIVPIFVGNDITEPLPAPSLARFDPDGLYAARAARRAFCVFRERLRQSGTPFALSGFDARAPLSAETHLRVEAQRLEICERVETALVRRRWAIALEALDELIADCRAHGTPMGVLLLPAEFQVHAEFRARLLARRGWDEARLDLALPQRRLQAFLTDRGVPCLDLLPYFAAATEDTYLPHDTHWNEAGHALTARAALPWLQASFPHVTYPLERIAKQP